MPQFWVGKFMQDRNEWERLANRMVGDQKWLIFELLETLTFVQLATAYAYHCMSVKGVGYTIP